MTIQTIRRLPLYLRKVREAIAAGAGYVSSAAIAKALNMDPVLVRKDLALTGVAGLPRLGFPAAELRDAILSCLGWDNNNEAVLCGTGNLGQALLGYRGFSEHSLSIVLAFDIDPQLAGTCIHGVPVKKQADMGRLLQRMKIRLGILTVPATAAQQVAAEMVAAGIVGIWNFTPVKLDVGEDVIVQNVDLAASLAILSHAVANLKDK